MAKKNTVDGAAAANEQRKRLANARLERREAVLAEILEIGQTPMALRELGESTQHAAVRREVLALADTIAGALDSLQRKAEALAGPGLSELLLPSGVQYRLQEADIVTVHQVRQGLADGASILRRLPDIGEVKCDLIRAYLEAFDAGEAPPPKSEIRGNEVTLTKREKVLAEKMGLSVQQAGDLLKGAALIAKERGPQE